MAVGINLSDPGAVPGASTPEVRDQASDVRMSFFLVPEHWFVTPAAGAK